MRSVFVDTSFLVAALSPRDRNHEAAMALKDTLGTVAPITTNHVVGECWTFARRRFGHAMARDLVDGLRASARYRIIHVDRPTEDLAHEWLHSHDEREYSFVDATSFMVMRKHDAREALAFDRDFEAAGFSTLRV